MLSFSENVKVIKIIRKLITELYVAAAKIYSKNMSSTCTIAMKEKEIHSDFAFMP